MEFTSSPAPAIVSAGKTYSYGDLDAAASRVARALTPSGDLAEQRVAIFVTPGFEWTAIAFGIWRAGGVVVPLALSHPPAELDYVIRDADASVVVSDDAALPTLGPIAQAAGARALAVSELLEARP